MNEKKYLKWYNKVGYGSGDIAGNVVYALLSAFVMIYLTDTAGLNAGVIGTLMMVARIFDGASDIFFGALIDKTRTRMGRARPWMLWAFFGCAALIIAIFAIPTTLGDNAKYAWFFITYTLLNAGFFTANNIAYSTLTALITKNSAERVQMGSIRFIFAFSTSLLIQTVTVEGVELFGGGEQGWRAIAIIYAVIGLAANTLSVMSVRELPDDELEDRPETEAGQEAGSPDGGREKAEGADSTASADSAAKTEGGGVTGNTGNAKKAEKAENAANTSGAEDAEADKPTARESARLLLGNRYYLIILVVFVLTQVFTATLNMGIYFMTYILKDANLLGPFAWAINVPLIAGLVLTPAIVSRFGRMQSVTTTGYAIAVVGRLGVVVAGYLGSVPLMLAFTALASIGMSPLQGTLNALIAEASEYTYLRSGKRIDGIMFSCTSLGVKVGGGVGTAMAGWLLASSGYVANADVQPDSTISMLYFMYLWIPAIANGIILLLLWRLDVEKANERLRAELAAEGGHEAGSPADSSAGGAAGGAADPD